MAGDSVSTSREIALNQLQYEQSELLDAVDKIRALGIGRLIELPQLIVCGDQSSGKSSVLEAISRVRFPAKTGVCTRFATEYILRRSPNATTKVTIEPGSSRTAEADKKHISEFTPSNAQLQSLEVLIEAAKQHMGILSENASSTGFSDDVLRIEISGPDKPELTLVDLPGIYRAKSSEQSSGGISIVQSLIERYMRNEKSIILAVISAKSEYNLQEILDLAEKHDPTYARTMGIITKPDTIEDPDEIDKYIQFVNNEKIKLHLGWHILRNRGGSDKTASDDDRDKSEREFFSQDQWARVSREFVGIDALRPRLSRILFNHIRQSLPELINQIADKTKELEAKLGNLGEDRSSLQQQRRFLVSKSSEFKKITMLSVNGMYLDPFFGGLTGTTAMSMIPHHRKLRAVVRDLNEMFALRIRRNGCRRRIVDSPTSSQAEDPDTPEEITRADLEEEISETARRYRGIELPGSANQLLVGELFRDQSTPWANIARQHLESVWDAARTFVESLARYLTDETTYLRLMHNILDPKLDEIKGSLLLKLDELMAYNRRGHPLPFEESFLRSTQEIQEERMIRKLEDAFDEVYGNSGAERNAKPPVVDVRLLATKALSWDKTSTRYATSDVIDLMEAYYDIALTTFIDNIAILAIENCLIQPLEDIFTPERVSDMVDNDIIRLAAEPGFVQTNRIQYRLDVEKLKVAQKTLGRYGTVKSRGTKALAVRPANIIDAGKDGNTSTLSSSRSPGPSSQTNPQPAPSVLLGSSSVLTLTPPQSTSGLFQSLPSPNATEDTSADTARLNRSTPSPAVRGSKSGSGRSSLGSVHNSADITSPSPQADTNTNGGPITGPQTPVSSSGTASPSLFGSPKPSFPNNLSSNISTPQPPSTAKISQSPSPGPDPSMTATPMPLASFGSPGASSFRGRTGSLSPNHPLAPQPPSLSGGFGSSSTRQPGFGGSSTSKSGFGGSSTSHPLDPQPRSPFGGFGSSSTSKPFSSNAPDSSLNKEPNGPYLIEKDRFGLGTMEHYTAITCHPDFRHYSFEELRFYRKG